MRTSRGVNERNRILLEPFVSLLQTGQYTDDSTGSAETRALQKSGGAVYLPGGTVKMVVTTAQNAAETSSYAAAQVSGAVSVDAVGAQYSFGAMCYFSGLSGNYDQAVYVQSYASATSTTTSVPPAANPCTSPQLSLSAGFSAVFYWNSAATRFASIMADTETASFYTLPSAGVPGVQSWFFDASGQDNSLYVVLQDCPSGSGPNCAAFQMNGDSNISGAGAPADETLFSDIRGMFDDNGGILQYTGAYRDIGTFSYDVAQQIAFDGNGCEVAYRGLIMDPYPTPSWGDWFTGAGDPITAPTDQAYYTSVVTDPSAGSTPTGTTFTTGSVLLDFTQVLGASGWPSAPGDTRTFMIMAPGASGYDDYAHRLGVGIALYYSYESTNYLQFLYSFWGSSDDAATAVVSELDRDSTSWAATLATTPINTNALPLDVAAGSATQTVPLLYSP